MSTFTFFKIKRGNPNFSNIASLLKIIGITGQFTQKALSFEVLME